MNATVGGMLKSGGFYSPFVHLRTSSPEERMRWRRRGKILAILGLALFALAPVLFAVAAAISARSFMSGGFGALSFLPVLVFPIAVLGMVLLAVGSIYLRMGYLKAASEVVATETGGAVEHSSAALGRGMGRGIRESGFEWGGRGREVVKVKCRACGFLESEDARYCSRCAKAV